MNLNQVTVYSSDVARAAEFYTRLGLRLIVDSIPRYARFECPDGESTFSIQGTDSGVGDPRIVLYFECVDVDAKVDELTRAGIAFDDGPSDKDWLWREARFRDPDGNRLVLFHGGENRKHPPWRVV